MELEALEASFHILNMLVFGGQFNPCYWLNIYVFEFTNAMKRMKLEHPFGKNNSVDHVMEEDESACKHTKQNNKENKPIAWVDQDEQESNSRSEQKKNRHECYVERMEMKWRRHRRNIWKDNIKNFC